MDTMKAWQYGSFNGNLEDSLTINPSIPLPTPSSLGKDKLLVKVISASINPVDYKLPESGIIGKLMVSLPATPGLDFCGRITAKHPSNETFQVGQLVFGGFNSSNQMGTLGEYTVISSQCCALVPPGVSPNSAAAVGTAATTAYQSLTSDTLQPGALVFINGGSGGVGTWSVQLAKALGANVVTTCSTHNVELCQSLGADEVIDYKKVDVVTHLRQKGPTFDLVIDNVGNDPELYNQSDLFIKPGGTFVQVGVGEAVSFKGVALTIGKQLWPSILRSRKFYFVNMKNGTECFQRIGGWMAEGKVKPVIAAEYRWEDVPEAFKKLREGHLSGKIVITVSVDA
ncbi:hypothetical protein B0J13DRAFT_546764 [Dactylonectria estremocensis]|uniref:Enoyl reductase (ER) domain-containing protein n=1 Tax=Dactylonectria estremocensis TaxID=1079267 RepID=A0A9P9F324_9HYPO|nr:hypothetical protein B0J13DRAFT_546764 [Dactylonectria estremocensis]